MPSKSLHLLLICTLAALGLTCSEKPIDHKTQEPEQDIESQLRDIFVLSEIEGSALELSEEEEVPYIEFQPQENRVMGYSGCNDFSGKLKATSAGTIVISDIISTLRACDNSKVESKIYNHLEDINKFKRDALKLYLYEGENLLLTYTKVD